MKVKDVKECSLPVWYSKFKNITIKSIIIPIPENGLKYFQDGGTLVLPDDTQVTETISTNFESDEWGPDSDHEIAPAPSLKEFSNEIQNAINRLGGKAFPKLNWSSPKDSSWISFNKSLECSCPNDVYLLLKSSTFVAHDLTCPFKDCDNASESEDIDYCLILRQWLEINPSDEFRCFVKNRKFIAISQRDPSQHYRSIINNIEEIKNDIFCFWKKRICSVFTCDSYVFDVHRPVRGAVTLVDFGPYGITTDALLFSWDHLMEKKVRDRQVVLELITDVCGNVEHVNAQVVDVPSEESSDNIEFRCVLDDKGIQPSPYMQYGLPVDVVDLSRGTDPLKMIDFLKMRIQSQNDEDTSSDEENVIS